MLVLGALLLLSQGRVSAQTPAPAPPPDPLMQLMLTQPPIDISTNINITASFDPPIITPDGLSTYRVTISAAVSAPSAGAR